MMSSSARATRLLLLLVLLSVCAHTPMVMADDAAEAVESSGWFGSGSDSGRALEEEEEDPYPELSWKRAGGPIFDPPGGMHKDSASILIYSLMGATGKVHYTLDGTEPTNKSTTFETRIELTEIGDYTVKACVSAEQRRDSVVATHTYHIRGEAAPPSAHVRQYKRHPMDVSEATESYLGSFEEGVYLDIWSSTGSSLVRYTVNGTDPTAELSEVAIGGGFLLTIKGNVTVKAATFPEGMMFPSEVRTFYVHVYPRPPRPAYTHRDRVDFLEDMMIAYRRLVDSGDSQRSVLHPPDLLPFIQAVLNPDAGQCQQCNIHANETEILAEGVRKIAIMEGLHVDDGIPLYKGFLTRGSVLREILDLNTEMRTTREQLRNGTVSVDEL